MKPAAEKSESLLAHRVAASEQSAGTSDEAIYLAIERRLGELTASGDVLDFGAGAGQLTLRLRSSGRYRTVTGADLFPRATNLPADVHWIEGDLNDRLPSPSASFDFIIAAEVIEHLENPRAVCRELFRLLRPGGHAVLSTPNNESWRSVVALLFRGHFVAFGDTSYPAHITALLRKDLERSLSEAGFDPPAFSFTDTGGIPGLPARPWQSLFGKHAHGVRYSDNLVVTARKAAS